MYIFSFRSVNVKYNQIHGCNVSTYFMITIMYYLKFSIILKLYNLFLTNRMYYIFNKNTKPLKPLSYINKLIPMH